MNLSEEHKEFVVKGYAQFMNRKTIVARFMDKFIDDLAELCDGPSAEDIRAYVYNQPDVSDPSAEEELATDKYTDDEGLCNELFNRLDKTQESYDRAKEQLASRFRRLDINHPQFPEKYRALFNETREQFFADQCRGDLTIPENVTRELEILYGLAKHRAFQNQDTKDIALAHQILKTFVAVNAVNAKQEPLDVTPQKPPLPANEPKGLADTDSNKAVGDTSRVSKALEVEDA